MPEMAVNYYYDDTIGMVYMHFSGDHRFKSNIYSKNVFSTAVATAKQIPVGKRRYDDTTKIWSFDADLFFVNLLPFFKLAPDWFDLRQYHTLIQWRIFIGEVIPEETKKRILPTDPDHVKAANFFNNFNTVVEQAVNTRDDRKTLVELTGVADYSVIDRADSVTLKKLYRQTAIKLHPDKNGGDHAKMSTFTQLWGIYVQPRT